MITKPKHMKKFYAALIAGALVVPTGCQNFLDVNTNPNAPQSVAANLYLAPMLHWMVTAPQFDGRYIGRITQEWMIPATGSTPGTWERMGYDPGADTNAEQWRDVYWSLGQNLVDMNTKAAAEERWDLLGVGQFMKAWGWQVLTDMHGEIVVKEAIDQSRTTFDYDTQEYAYQQVRVLLDSAIANLQRTDGAVNAGYLAIGDHIYNGDRTKWLKLAYGLYAMNLSHYSNKSSYKPADVIAAVDKSLASNADDALLKYEGTNNNDTNFFGWTRNNFRSYRQTQFILNLMNGTDFGGVVDPRLTRTLSPSRDGGFRGLDPKAAPTVTPADSAVQPFNFYGFPGTSGQGPGTRYIFSDKVKMPFMTYAQLQFVKAEAAYRMGDKATALAAYRNGISSSIDFVNSRNTDDNQAVTQITSAEKTAFLAAPEIVPTSPGGLTLSHIMSQKYIAQWGWGHNELFMDMRRYHYTDIDPASGKQVFIGFVLPTNLYPDNGGKILYRVRPRFNSEYVWNLEALKVIGADQLDYHTKPTWIILP